MDDFESRLRAGLRRGLAPVDTEGLIDGVVAGAARRRRRRAALAVVATVLVVAGTIGAVAALTSDGRDDAGPIPLTPTPTPTQAPLPADAARGVIDVAAPSSDEVFRLTTNVGCVACSTVWREDASVEGGWKRLHDFGAEAYAGKASPSFGPVSNFVMAAGGRDGWAWGSRLYSTHDRGETWTAVTSGPGRENNDYGHLVQVTDQYAWSLLSTDSATELWRTALGSDTWSRIDAPNMGGVTGLVTVRSHVALEESDEGLAGPRLLISSDGSHWSRLDLPCASEPRVRSADSEVFALCTSLKDPMAQRVYRTRNLGRWELVGHWTGVVDTFRTLADDRVLLARSGGRAGLMTPGGTTPVDLGDARDTGIYESASVGDLVFLVSFDGNSVGRLLRSTDGGLTWQAD